jgi:hypothetical protein
MATNQETHERSQERSQERSPGTGSQTGQQSGGSQQAGGSPQSQASGERVGSQSSSGAGGGARSQGSRGSTRPLRIQERGKEAYKEAQALASTLEQAVDEIGQFLREQAERRPYVSLATAAGIGYVLGGGVPSRLTGFIFGLSSRFAVEMFLRELIGGATGAGSSAAPSNATQRSVS